MILQQSDIEVDTVGQKVKTFVYLQNILAAHYDRF